MFVRPVIYIDHHHLSLLRASLIYTYMMIHRWFRVQNLSNKQLTPMLAGGAAGIIVWLPPLYFTDVIKSRMTTAEVGKYRGVWDCARKLYREGGRKVFFRCGSSCVVRMKCLLVV